VPYAISASVPDGHGALSCDSPVAHGDAAACTLTPDAGYRLAALTDNGADVFGAVVADQYALPAVTAPHAVVATFAPMDSPAVPTRLAQFQYTASTVWIPLGGEAPETAVRLRGVLTDPDPGQTVRLQVEVKPAGVPFDGTVSCQSRPVSSGTRTQCTPPPLTPGTAYHWQARSRDSAGVVSPWVSFGGNADPAAVDFVVANRPPHAPTGLAQFVRGVRIPLGRDSVTTAVRLRGVPTDPDPGQTVRLQVEVKPAGVAFDETVSCQSRPVSSGTRTQCTPPLTPGTAYHWQARSVDSAGVVSPWVSFGGNADPAAVDFVAVNRGPGAPTGLDQVQFTNSSTWIPVRGVVPETSVRLRGIPMDPDVGQTVQLEVEVQPAGVPFGEEDTMLICRSGLVPSGTRTWCTVSGLTSGQAYYWRARSRDSAKGAGPWVSFGGNSDYTLYDDPAGVDFRVCRDGSWLYPCP
jgi:hypothetical protein